MGEPEFAGPAGETSVCRWAHGLCAKQCAAAKSYTTRRGLACQVCNRFLVELEFAGILLHGAPFSFVGEVVVDPPVLQGGTGANGEQPRVMVLNCGAGRKVGRTAVIQRPGVALQHKAGT